MKGTRQNFDWPAGIIDRVSSQMQGKKEKGWSEMVSLTAKMEARMDSNTWTGIEEDSEGERDGKGVK